MCLNLGGYVTRGSISGAENGFTVSCDADAGPHLTRSTLTEGMRDGIDIELSSIGDSAEFSAGYAIPDEGRWRCGLGAWQWIHYLHFRGSYEDYSNGFETQIKIIGKGNSYSSIQ